MSFEALKTDLRRVMAVFRQVLKRVVLVFRRVEVWHIGKTQAWVSLDPRWVWRGPRLGLARPCVGQARPTPGFGQTHAGSGRLRCRGSQPFRPPMDEFSARTV
jgi:hypothetical protein